MDPLNNLHITLSAKTVSSFIFIMSGYQSYPHFRFYIEGFDYSCSTANINQMDLTLIRAGTNYTISRYPWIGTTCSNSMF